MLNHLSGSCLNLFDSDIEARYTRYVLGQEPDYPPAVLQAFEFGKRYEETVAESLFKGYKQQVELREYIWGYEMLGYLDFMNGLEVVECKTKSGWWSEKDIHTSWQFRFYNWWCNKNEYKLVIHQYNKKTNKSKTQYIDRDDPTFESEFIKKANQISFFLSQYGKELECSLKNS